MKLLEKGKRDKGEILPRTWRPFVGMFVGKFPPKRGKFCVICIAIILTTKDIQGYSVL